MIGSEHLTSSNPELQQKIAATVPGMAHFAELDGRACGDCVFWGGEKARKDRNYRCRKAMAMGCVTNGGLPFDTPACKHFEARPAKERITRKRLGEKAAA